MHVKTGRLVADEEVRKMAQTEECVAEKEKEFPEIKADKDERI